MVWGVGKVGCVVGKAGGGEEDTGKTHAGENSVNAGNIWCGYVAFVNEMWQHHIVRVTTKCRSEHAVQALTDRRKVWNYEAQPYTV